MAAAGSRYGQYGGHAPMFHQQHTPAPPHPAAVQQRAIEGYQEAMLCAQFWANQLPPGMISPSGAIADPSGRQRPRCRFFGPGTKNDCRRGAQCPFRHEYSPSADVAGQGHGRNGPQLCRFYGPGTPNDCRRGSECPFVHNSGEPKARQRCRFWGSGTPNDCRRGDQCPYAHDESLGEVDRPRCRYYPGDCRRGMECPFRHDDTAGPDGGASRCRFYGPGTPNDCRRGVSCPYIHTDQPMGR
eukprot:TRINITY_DN47276_c0_g1_i1.p1 TRINITY_DN47276_c0_g1~~TRINITY_DN47276_c0_g1_i1.p1  ORF type:complete len:266 (+),score=35.11 TRINITY_DN47276_c0_g1_i1:73-798(+)